ncbi:MAG: hypothetical protein GY832_26490 [Chloroflexi bacterium]|nr:hypothetical protein [Chloroflexota bacterium]
MPRIQVSLNDEIAQKLASRAAELGLALDKFMTQAIQQNSDKLTRPKMWIPREEWDARVRGDGCPDCVHLATGENPHVYTIAYLRASRLDLLKAQFVPGCCVLYYKQDFPIDIT